MKYIFGLIILIIITSIYYYYICYNKNINTDIDVNLKLSSFYCDNDDNDDNDDDNNDNNDNNDNDDNDDNDDNNDNNDNNDKKKYNDKRMNCWIDIKIQEFDEINNNITIIIDELNNILKLKKWSRWSEYDKINTPTFTKMSNTDIENRLKENEDYLNSNKPSWRIFGLKLYGKEFEDNAKYCPKTLVLFKNIDYILNIGFSCLEPNVSTLVHRDYNHRILRCHFPLIIPEGDCAIKVGNKIKKWIMNEYFIFDDTCYHEAWNNTSSNRFILIVDIDKEKINKLGYTL